MNTIEVMTNDIEPPSWMEKVTPLVECVLQYHNCSDVSCSVMFCNNEYMTQLNETYRKQNVPTDVLSFCQQEGELLPAEFDDAETQNLGDIVVSLEYVRENAQSFHVPEEQEIRRVIIHGVLHLLGYDHETNDSDEKMLQLQEKLVKLGESLF